MATVPGLRMAIQLADGPFVFHDRGARTFHPKIYLAQGPGKAMLLVGSSNLTAGGLYSNYEASLEAEFALPEEEHEQALTAVRDYVATLLADEELCLPLDEELLERLVADPRYSIAPDERRSTPGAGRWRSGRGGDLWDEPAREGAGAAAAARGAGGATSSTAETPPSDAGRARPRRRQRRALDQGAAGVRCPAPALAQLEPARQPALDQGGPPDRLADLVSPRALRAGGLAEETDRRGNPIEIAEIPFAVTDRRASPWVCVRSGRPRAPSGVGAVESRQRPSLGTAGPVLRATDYTDYAVTLERLADGSYRLDISL